MKRPTVLITVLVFTVAAASVCFYLFSPTSAPERKANGKISYNAFYIPAGSFFGKYKFPLTVGFFKKNLGMPGETIIDKSEPCPVGQVHYWCLPDKNLKVIVLGDSHKTQIDYSAPSRLYAVAKCDPEKETTFDGLWGVHLGDPDTVVRENLNKLVKKDGSLYLTKNSTRSPIHSFLPGNGMKHQYILSKDGMSFFFIIGDDERLESIMYAAIDVQAAC